MGYGRTEVEDVWSDLRRKEERLQSDGHQYGFRARRFDSMGRPVDTCSYSSSSWGREQMGRVNRVRQALHDSGPMAQRMIAQTLSGINLSTIWHILVSACQDIALYYGGSVAAGGMIGGIGGAFLGGVGAIPGAAAGAAAGSYVGGWVLAMLGLRSLVAGVAQAIPEALRYYEKGIVEAWGPSPRNHHHCDSLRRGGSTFFAAGDLASGHVIMISVILAVLAAYVARGKADKAVLLAEIRKSPRLGPKVATWVEQNEDKLRQHGRLRSRGSGGGGMGREEPPQPQRRRAPEKEREGHPPNGMPKKKVPCFTTKGMPQGSVPEFDRQLAGQEAGINSMTVAEYLEGREAFEAGDSVRDRSVARDARANYEAKVTEELSDSLRGEGLSARQADKKAAEIAADRMKTLAALHNPDMVAGGKDSIGDFGDGNINKRIGAQWKKRHRLSELDKAARDIAESMRGSTKMNAQLERCK